MDSGYPGMRDYDGLGTTGSGVLTHKYYDASTGQLGLGAIVMNRFDDLGYNTIMQSFPWSDIRDPAGTPQSPSPEVQLMEKILGATLELPCLRPVNPTDASESDDLQLPRQTALHQNMPNPFNPTTVIRFDLATDSDVEFRIYDVAGRLVRTLVNQPMERKRHAVVWDGMDGAGVPVSSGIYFYRLEAGDFTDSRKMVVLR